uniref:2-hydroxychromene-2-carboxylate isomerase n=1 Tax=uncultured Acidovorax sp. TaxID=158751 RepID=UPI0025CFFE17|nr:2-hydroxychromene-2-carboxylate isomerase [uncultured Acidovorax sp.]
MEKTVEFYFDVGSPASYIAHKRLRAGFLGDVPVQWKPILLGGLLQSIGNPMPTAVAAKRAWMEVDFARSAQRIGIPFVWNHAFPVNTMFWMRALTAMVGRPQFLPLADAVFDALWAGDLDLSKPEQQDTLLRQVGLVPQSLDAMASDEGVKSRLRAETAALAERGGFGAPTFFVGDEMFFGQDRMDFVAQAVRSLA